MEQEFVSLLVEQDAEKAAKMENLLSHRFIKKLNATKEEVLNALKSTEYRVDEESSLIYIGVKVERKVVIFQSPVQTTIDVCIPFS